MRSAWPTARKRMVADATTRDLAELFKALGDPTRVRILSALHDAEVCVGDLTDTLGMGQSAVSHQLRYLRETEPGSDPPRRQARFLPAG